jgi:transcriptional regulator with PAS, ATPase and Fis domain
LKLLEIILVLNRALEKAIQVAPTDISVLGYRRKWSRKRKYPQNYSWQYSHRKHAKYIAVNCGAIPDGTIDSVNLFGHEKGAFTGATAIEVDTLR